MRRRRPPAELAPYIGQQVLDCAYQIEAIAAGHNLTVDILDPLFNTGPIEVDKDAPRLEVHTDENGTITKFEIG